MSERESNGVDRPVNENASLSDRFRNWDDRALSMRLNEFYDSKPGTAFLWVLGVIFLIPWLAVRACGAVLRLVNPRYRRHMRMFRLQNLHLDGLHDEGPDQDCEYCVETVRYFNEGGYYRPWSKKSLDLSSLEETRAKE